jgi:hypothetical protein
MPSFQIENWIRPSDGGPPLNASLRMYCLGLDSPVLKYKYACGGMWGGFWPSIGEKLMELTKTEIEKLDPKNRPYNHSLLTVEPDSPLLESYQPPAPWKYGDRTFNRPSTWTYYDDQLPQWCKDWERERLNTLAPCASRQLEKK